MKAVSINESNVDESNKKVSNVSTATEDVWFNYLFTIIIKFKIEN
jgi:hypothetical protein